ncbi:lactonase family protein [Maribacter sp. 2307ULW6-5]|uniref:lactonase family protein n=1 Tax=Maribacter sp. 2307ULW6-5 TaxID=3386275 RepID=UPI0039BD2892
MKHSYLSFTALLLFACASKEKSENVFPLFVGTYTQGASGGIYQLIFNASTGQLSGKKVAAVVENPSFIKLSADGTKGYAVLETDGFEGGLGAVGAYTVEAGKWTPTGAVVPVGPHPCHLALSPNEKLLAVSSYSGGSVSLLSLRTDGSFDGNVEVLNLNVKDSTKASHAHAAQFTQDGLFVADLGMDAVFRFQSTGGGFVPAGQERLSLPQGAGPRHFTFSGDGSRLYVINELNSTITVFGRTAGGEYREMEHHSTLAANFKGESFCADIHLSPDGKFLYGSNRGENSIVIFNVHPETGALTLVGREPVRGNWPRNFSLDPTGRFLLVANQKSDNITVFERDTLRGTLTFVSETALPSPVCLEFL